MSQTLIGCYLPIIIELQLSLFDKQGLRKRFDLPLKIRGVLVWLSQNKTYSYSHMPIRKGKMVQSRNESLGTRRHGLWGVYRNKLWL